MIGTRWVEHPAFRRGSAIVILCVCALALALGASPALAATPTVTSISPTSGSPEGGTAVTIKGTEFVAGAEVTIGGVNATSVTVVSATEIKATTPAGVRGGKEEVLVSDTNGTASSGPIYTYEGLVGTIGSSTAGTLGGLFTTVGGVAVKESSGDVYVADTGNNRVQEFTSTGAFIRAWGWSVVSTGASGTGTLADSSTSVTAVTTMSKALLVGETITGAGIQAGTTITAVGSGTMTLSQATTATAAGTGVALTVAEGAGNVPVNAQQTVTLGSNTTGGSFTLTYTTPNPSPSTETATIPYHATATELQNDLAALANIGSGNVAVTGSAGGPWTVEFKGTRFADTNVTLMTSNTSGLSVSSGSPSDTVVTSREGASAFEVCTEAASCIKGVANALGGGMSSPESVAVNQSSGDVYVSDSGFQRIDEFGENGVFIRTFGEEVVSTGPDKADATQRVTVDATGGTFTLSFGGSTTVPIEFDASDTEVQLALDTLGSIGGAGGSVSVTGGPGSEFGEHPYLVTFGGSLGGVAQPVMTASGASLTVAGGSPTVTVATTNAGATGFDICTAASGDVCKTGVKAETGGALASGITGTFTGYLAVDPVNGNVVAADNGNNRVQEYGAAGEFIRAAGWYVVTSGPDLNAKEYDVCVAANGDICHDGAAGTGLGEFESSEPNWLAVDGLGEIFTDSYGAAYGGRLGKLTPFAGTPPLKPSLCATKLTTALGATAKESPIGVAVEPDANGERLLVVKGVAETESIVELASEGECSIAGEHYAGQKLPAEKGLAYWPNPGQPSEPELYYSTGDLVDILSFTPAVVPKPEASLGASSSWTVTAHSATLTGTVNPEGFETSYEFEYSTTGITWTDASATGVSAGDGTSTVNVSTAVTLKPGTLYLVRLTARNAGGVYSTPSSSLETPSAPPDVSQMVASEVSPTSATLTAYVNPNNSSTAYQFNWGTSEAYGNHVPALPRQLGAGGVPLLVSETITGLTPETTYHFQAVATSTAPGETVSPDMTFTTPAASCPNEDLRTGPSATEPECRALEKVTPAFKEGYNFRPNETFEQGSFEEGPTLIGTSLGSFAGTEDNTTDGGGTYKVTRTESGWQTTALDPPASQFPSAKYLATSANSEKTLWELRAPNEPVRAESFYLENEGIYTEIGPIVPRSDTLGPPSNEPSYEVSLHTFPIGASDELSHVVYSLTKTEYLFPGDANSTTQRPSLYEYSGTGDSEPSLVGLTSAGGRISNCGEELGSGSDSTQGAISADGETVFFTPHVSVGTSGEACTGAPNVAEVYARIGGTKTVDISEPPLSVPGRLCTGICEEDENEASSHKRSAALFQAASEAGSKVFFTTEQPLVNGDTDAKNDLYEDEIENGEVKSVTQVSHDPNAGEAAEVQGVMLISTEGSHVYFVAKGVLTGTPNDQGQEPAPGADNLYVYERDSEHTAGRLVFIATLSSTDSAGWKSENKRPAQATPEGRFLIFESHADLTPDDTTSATQVFRYDAKTGDLLRVSHGQAGYDSNGNTLANSAAIREPQYQDNGWDPSSEDRLQALAISNNGSTVVFSTEAALSSDDTNGLDDAYVWDEGEVAVLSTGTGEHGDSGSPHLTSSGRDVFFETKDPLLPSDGDTQYDTYDARVDGGFPEPTPAPSCTGSEGCQGPLTAALAPVPLASTGMPAIGNASPQPESKTTTKAVKPKTRAQKLASALKGCRKDRSKRKRATCEKQVRKRYGASKAKAKKKSKSRKGGK